MFDNLKSMIETIFNSDISTIANIFIVIYIITMLILLILKGRKKWLKYIMLFKHL